MNSLETIVRRVRLAVAVVAALGLLVLPAAASAKRHHDRTPRDRNHDGIPDKWEKRMGVSTKKHGLAKADQDKDGLNTKSEWQSRTNPKMADTNGNGVADANEDPDRDRVDNGNEARERTKPRKADSDRDGVKDGKEDADRDKLNNAGEDDAGTDPINADTDGDGIEDGDESAGEIVAWDGTTLTLHVYGGSDVSGTVDEDTYIDCVDDSSSADDGSGDDASGDDPGADLGDDYFDDESADDAALDDIINGKARAREVGDDVSGDDPGADDGSDDGSDDSSGGDDSGDDSGGDSGDDSGDDAGAGGCSPDVLKVGAVVSEAAFSVTPDGTYFDTLELAR